MIQALESQLQHQHQKHEQQQANQAATIPRLEGQVATLLADRTSATSTIMLEQRRQQEAQQALDANLRAVEKAARVAGERQAAAKLAEQDALLLQRRAEGTLGAARTATLQLTVSHQQADQQFAQKMLQQRRVLARESKTQLELMQKVQEDLDAIRRQQHLQMQSVQQQQQQILDELSGDSKKFQHLLHRFSSNARIARADEVEEVSDDESMVLFDFAVAALRSANETMDEGDDSGAQIVCSQKQEKVQLLLTSAIAATATSGNAVMANFIAQVTDRAQKSQYCGSQVYDLSDALVQATGADSRLVRRRGRDADICEQTRDAADNDNDAPDCIDQDTAAAVEEDFGLVQA